MTNIILFDFENNSIRFVGTADKPEWVAADVCKALSIVNVSDALESLDLDEKGIANTDDGSLTGSQMLTVNESGLYRLVFKSRKAAAERMRKWIFSTVLPSIRKTGSYSIAPAQQIALKPYEENVLIAQSIRNITDTLDDNPRLAQFLIDQTIDQCFSKQLSLSSRELPIKGAAEIAESLGLPVNMRNRLALGKFMAKQGHAVLREERLCNGQMRLINCYHVTPEVENSVRQFFG